MAVNYRGLVVGNVYVPPVGVRRVQQGVVTLSSSTTDIPLSSLISSPTKIYHMTTFLDSNSLAGAQGYTAELIYGSNVLRITTTGTPSSGSEISWTVLEIY